MFTKIQCERCEEWIPTHPEAGELRCPACGHEIEVVVAPAPVPPAAPLPAPVPEPDAKSDVGAVLQTLGVLALISGLFALFTFWNAMAAAALIGGGLALATIGVLFHILAVLRVIAHRLRK